MFRNNLYRSFKTNRILNKLFSVNLQFTPKHLPPLEEDIKVLQQFFATSTRMVILTGAGISTESGIPDYRSDEVGLYARTNHKPIRHGEFVNSSIVRQRYWARNYVGWQRFSSCQPNRTHRFIKDLEIKYNKVGAVVTQNVDGLQFAAGSRNVVELHGTAFRVVCLNCNNKYSRHEIQDYLNELNPNFDEAASTMVRPDGDVEICSEKVKEFKPPFCVKCRGALKSDIVFFGDNVPRRRVDQVRDFVSLSDSLLVLGSSLTVFSGYRIVLQAAEEKKTIAIVNIGPTRADHLANVKISAECGDVLDKMVGWNVD